MGNWAAGLRPSPTVTTGCGLPTCGACPALLAPPEPLPDHELFCTKGFGSGAVGPGPLPTLPLPAPASPTPAPAAPRPELPSPELPLPAPLAPEPAPPVPSPDAAAQEPWFQCRGPTGELPTVGLPTVGLPTTGLPTDELPSAGLSRDQPEDPSCGDLPPPGPWPAPGFATAVAAVGPATERNAPNTAAANRSSA